MIVVCQEYLQILLFNDTAPDASTLFTVGSKFSEVNYSISSGSYSYDGCIAFSEVAGYTNMFKAGKYTGNGNADGTFVYTGFRPSLIRSVQEILQMQLLIGEMY